MRYKCKGTKRKEKASKAYGRYLNKLLEVKANRASLGERTAENKPTEMASNFFISNYSRKTIRSEHNVIERLISANLCFDILQNKQKKKYRSSSTTTIILLATSQS